MRTSYKPFGGLRVALALAVVVSHSTPLEVPDSFLAAMGIGNIAVMAFFVLSGFIITEAAATFYQDRPVAFLGNRFWRIVPPYWAALIVSIAIHYALVQVGTFQVTDAGTPTEALFTARNIWANVIAIFPRPNHLRVDVPGGYYGFVRFSWAVYVEAMFYLATFASMALILFLGKRHFIADYAVASSLVAHVVNEYWVPFSYHWEMQFTPYFVLGVCLYAMHERPTIRCGIGVVVSYGLSALHFSRYIQGKADIGTMWLRDLVVPAHLATLTIFMLLPALILLLARTSVSEKAAQLDRRLGDLTYPIYLNHFAVLVVAFSFDWRFRGVTIAIAAISIALTALLNAAVEKPLKPLRNRIRGCDLVDSGVPEVHSPAREPAWKRPPQLQASVEVESPERGSVEATWTSAPGS